MAIFVSDDPLVFQAFPDLIMLRPLVVSCQDFPRFGGYVGALVLFARELPDGLPRVKPHNGDELHLVVLDRPSKELDSSVAGDIFGSDAWENLFLEQVLVLVRVLGRRPPVPDSADHKMIPLSLTLCIEENASSVSSVD
jgi:hypothetical protein